VTLSPSISSRTDARHLVIAADTTSVYTNTVLHQVANLPRYAAKHAEDMKFLVVRSSRHPIATPHGGSHILVPFAIEDGCKLGAHAHALQRALTTLALASDMCFKHAPCCTVAPPARSPSGGSGVVTGTFSQLNDRTRTN
jgi:hypothetical protein